MLKYTRSVTQATTWTHNFGNAFYCHADLLAMSKLCGVPLPISRRRGVFNGTGVTATAAWQQTLQAASAYAPERQLSRPCMHALLCRDPSIGRGACWGSYGYYHVLPELTQDFYQRLPALLPGETRLLEFTTHYTHFGAEQSTHTGAHT